MIDWINHVPGRIAEAEYGEEGGIYTFQPALHRCVFYLLVMSGATVQIQCICGGSARPELQCLVFGRATQKISRVRGRRCNFSHMQSWISYVILLFWRSSYRVAISYNRALSLYWMRLVQT